LTRKDSSYWSRCIREFGGGGTISLGQEAKAPNTPNLETRA
jgi:hypothetical protein